MFDDICGLCVNVISIPASLYLISHLFSHNEMTVGKGIGVLAIGMLIWIAIDFILATPIFYLNNRFKWFHSEWTEREEINRRSREIDETLAREFGVDHAGQRLSEKRLWRRP